MSPFATRALRSIFCIAVSVLAAAGCASGPTAVSQAQLYQPGVAEYDKFFARLHDIQDTVAKAPSEREAARKTLAAELGLDSNASGDTVGKKLEARVAELRKQRSVLAVELVGLDGGEGPPAALVTLTNSAGKEQSTSLTRALSQAGKQSVALAVEVRKAGRAADELQVQLPKLDAELETRFKLLGPARTNEARRNLNDAKVQLPTLARSLESAARDVGEILDALKKAAPPEKKHPAGRRPVRPGPKKPEPAGDDYQP